MKRILLLSTLFLASNSLMTSSLHAADPLPPKIQVLSPDFDFGTVTEGTRVKHDFEVANIGGTELVIQQVVPACGCTAAVAQSKNVAPGGKTIVHVEFDSSGFVGEKTKNARINSNDPENPSVFIALKGVIETELSTDPERIQFGEFVSSADIALPEIKGTVTSKGATQITSITSGSPALVVNFEKKSTSQWAYTVKPVEGIVPGDIRDRVIIGISKQGEKREVSIPVLGRVIGPVVLKPSSLAMGVIDGTAPIERRMQLESRRKVAFAITKIESDNPAVTVSKKEIEPGRNMVLIVSVDPKKMTGDLRSTVTLTFDDSSLAPVQFSVYAVRPAKAE